MLVNSNFIKLFLGILLIALAAFAPVCAQISAQNDGPIPCSAPTLLTPVWGKLVITDNVVRCYYATGGAAPTVWTEIGQPRTIGFLNNPLLVGIYITAHNASAIASGTIDYFSITPAPTYRLHDQDIGAPQLMGSANLMSGVWTISGSGADIWNTFDQFNFQPWLVWGDCTVICRVTSLSRGDPWQKIGIMVRDGFNSGSDYALFCATYSKGVDFQYRPDFFNNGDTTSYVAAPAGTVSGIAVGMGITGTFQGPYVVRP